MSQGDKSKYTDKQKRKAEHIEEGYEKRGVPPRMKPRPALGQRSTNRTAAAKKPGGSGRKKNAS